MSKKILSFFSTEVDKRTLDEVMAEGQKTVTQELEMMAVLAAMKVWQKLIKACRVVLFTDSEAVRGSFLKSWSANNDSDKMMNIIFQVEGDFDIPVWIERVPSQSSPSDILSRETVAEFEGADKAEVDPWVRSSLADRDIPKALNGGESAAVGSVTAIFPFSKKECGCSACFLDVESKMHMSLYWQPT